jgi:ADP-ribose pyrophosphatase YjhB (NUDIX family)
MEPGPVHPVEERAAFCLHCGAPLARLLRFGRMRKSCPECGFVLFVDAASAAAVVIVEGRRVLLVRRAIEPGRGRWGFPAGFQDYGESLEMTAIREAAEETGLTVELRRLLTVTLSREHPTRLVNLTVYLAVAVAGELRAADDADAAEYFSVDDVPVELAFANNREILQRLRTDHPRGDIT